MDARTLHTAIIEVCPVNATSVGVEDDRSTWLFEPSEGATQAQITAGDNVIATIPVDYVAPKPLTPDEQLAFDHENRLRVLEGQPPLTQEDFITMLAGA